VNLKVALLLGVASASFPALAKADQVAAAEHQAAMVGEVIVTAQRRAQSLLEVPAAISAVSAQALENQGIRSVLDIGQSVPGLVVDRNGGGTQAAIRGVTTQVTGAGSDANVAIYVDGVYQALTQANNFRFPDLERVEVLKGPQGSLYGRNATGGAILFVTLGPQFTAQGKATAEYSSFNSVLLNGFVTGPISDSVAASLSASYTDSDGYVDDLVRGGKANPSKSFDVRGKLLWRISGAVDAQLTGFYTNIEDPTPFAAASLDGNTIGRRLGANYSARPWKTANDVQGFTRNKQYGGVAKLSADLDFATVTMMGAYTEYRLPYRVDIDNSTARVVTILGPTQNFRNIQNEIVLRSNSTHGIQWLVGANYYDMNQLTIQDTIVAAGTSGTYRRLRTKAYSAFADLTLPLTERLTATAGFRYTVEEASLRSRLGLNASKTEPFPFIGDDTWKSGTPKLSLRYELAERTNVYASYSRGFKSGIFNPNGLTTVDPEKLDAYEVGLKTESVRDVSLSLSAFYYDYKDQQVSTSIQVNGAPQGAVQNAGKSRNYGLDGEVMARLTSSFTLRGALSLLNTKFTEFRNAVILIPTGLGGNTQITLPNARGKQSLRAPKWTLAVSGDYHKEFDFGRIDASATIFHSDKYFLEYGNRVTQPAYTTLDGRISWSPPSSRMSVYVFGRNLTDEQRITSALVTALSDTVVYAPPRSIGVGVNYQF